MNSSNGTVKVRFNVNEHCPVCGTGTKGCSRIAGGADGDVILCRGRTASVGDKVNGRACLKTGDEWCTFRAEPDPPFRGRDGPAQESSPPPLFDWPERHRKAREKLTAARLEALAATLGVPEYALAVLEPGYDYHGRGIRGGYTFPMVDGGGTVCGLHWRDEQTGEKEALTGGKLGVFAPAGWKTTEGPFFLPEGGSDTATLVALGLPTLGRPSARAGVQVMADTLLGIEREIVVLGELDPNTDTGDWPGRDGAIATATKLAAALGHPVSWAFPPDRAKDVRVWFKAQGLTEASGADDCHAAGERFAAGIHRIVVEPPEGGEEDPALILTEDDIPTLADARQAGASKRWLWPGWIQADVLNGMAGEFGHGKTRLVAELIRRVRAGECWPDGSEMTLPPDSRFLFVPADYQHSELCDLADKYGFPDGCIYLNAMKDAPEGVALFDAPRSIACLEKRIGILQPALVIIDPITATTTAEHSHNLAEGGTALYGPLQRLARKYGVTFHILIHVNAQGTTYGRHARGKFRTQMTLVKVEVDGGEERYRLEVSKSNSKAPDALGASQQDGRWDFDANPPEKDAGNGKPGPRPSVDVKAGEFLRKFLGSSERKQVEVIDAWKQDGHGRDSIFAAARRMEADGELLPGVVESPSGRKMLKTWQLRPPTSSSTGTVNGQDENEVGEISPES